MALSGRLDDRSRDAGTGWLTIDPNSREVGGALSVAVFGALLAGPAGFLSGLRTSLLPAAAVALAAAGCALLLRVTTRRGRPATGQAVVDTARVPEGTTR